MMKHRWSEKEAIKCLESNGTTNVLVASRAIFGHSKGLNGLKQCSALDYLTIHCYYRYFA